MSTQNDQNDGPDGHRLAVGTDGWKIVSALAPDKNDIVVNKESCNSFYQTDLMDQLTELGAKRLIVGSCITQFCVDTTVRRAVTMGFDVVLWVGHWPSLNGSLTIFEEAP